jgi:aryl-alcohol dehydrogenase-like predicted oxidoreductase
LVPPERGQRNPAVRLASPAQDRSRARNNPVLGNPEVITSAARLGYTPAQVALAWLLRLRPNLLLIPGTTSLRHLEEDMAVANIELDAEARQLRGRESPGSSDSRSP